MLQRETFRIGLVSLLLFTLPCYAADPSSYDPVTNSCKIYQKGFIGECGDLSDLKISFKINVDIDARTAMPGLKLGPLVTVIDNSLTDADLRGLHVNGASWVVESLSDVDIRGADLHDIDLAKTTFSDVIYNEKTIFPKGFHPHSDDTLLFHPSLSYRVKDHPAEFRKLKDKRSWKKAFRWSELSTEPGYRYDDPRIKPEDNDPLYWFMDPTAYWDGKLYQKPAYQSSFTQMHADFPAGTPLLAFNKSFFDKPDDKNPLIVKFPGSRTAQVIFRTSSNTLCAYHDTAYDAACRLFAPDQTMDVVPITEGYEWEKAQNILLDRMDRLPSLRTFLYLDKTIVDGLPWFKVNAEGKDGWIPGYSPQGVPQLESRFGMGC